MEFDFSGELWFWRGPAPFHFVTVPDEACAEIHEEAASVTYGWGMIPAAVRIGGTEWQTSLWPKDGRYIVPIKQAVQRAEGLELGDVLDVHLFIDA